jgi:hypothetical protein
MNSVVEIEMQVTAAQRAWLWSVWQLDLGQSRLSTELRNFNQRDDEFKALAGNGFAAKTDGENE